MSVVSFINNQSIRRKGIFLIAVPLVMQLIFLLIVVAIQRTNAEAQAWSGRSAQVSADAQIVLAELALTEASTAGAIITQDPQWFDHYEKANGEVAMGLAQLTAAVAGDPAQAARVQRLAALTDDFLAWHRTKVELTRSGHPDAAVERAKTLGGMQRMDSIRDELNRILTAEVDVSGSYQADLARSQWRLKAMLYAGIVVSILLSVVIATAFSRSISARLTNLAENARRLAQGDSSVAPPAVRDEIAEVDLAVCQVVRDMSHGLMERKRAEEAIRRVKDDLENRVSKRTAELQELNRELSYRNEENEAFVYSVSHDLRSPLVNLLGFSRELDRVWREVQEITHNAPWPTAVAARMSKLLDVEAPEATRFIENAVTRLSRIIDALLRLSRAGQVDYQWTPVDVNQTVQNVVDSLSSTIRDKGATVTVAELPAVLGDPTAVEMIFANLINNSLNYSDPARPALIEVGCLEATEAPVDDGQGPHCTLFVRDNGIGIPPAFHDKIFRVFQRLSPNSAMGEGVGLAMLKRIIARHRGRMWFESEQGMGTTFFIDLHAAHAAVLV